MSSRDMWRYFWEALRDRGLPVWDIHLTTVQWYFLAVAVCGALSWFMARDLSGGEYRPRTEGWVALIWAFLALAFLYDFRRLPWPPAEALLYITPPLVYGVQQAVGVLVRGVR